MERKLLYKLKIGSHLYGLNTPESDTDYMSVIMPLPLDLLGLQVLEEINNSTKSSSESRRNTSNDIDDISYTLRRFIHLLINGNPSMTESLFSDKKNIEFESPLISELKSFLPDILSERIKKSFLGFAFAQKNKLLVKSSRYFSLQKCVKYLEENFKDKIYTNKKDQYELSEEQLKFLNNSIEYYKGEKHNIEHFHKGMSLKVIYERLKKEYDQYGWRVKTEDFETLKYDSKFGYHSIRLLIEGKELASTGKLTMPIPEPYHTLLMDIKKGLFSYEELIKLYDKMEKEILNINSALREKPNFNKINDWLVSSLLKEFKSY